MGRGFLRLTGMSKTQSAADEAIAALGTKAGVAGNFLLVAICEVALWGQADVTLSPKDQARIATLSRADARHLAGVALKRNASATFLKFEG